MSFEHLSGPPRPSEYVDHRASDIFALPAGTLFIKEAEYWQAERATAQEAGSDDWGRLADLMDNGLHDLAVGLVAVNRAMRLAPQLPKTAEAAAQWYGWAGMTFGNSRLVRAFQGAPTAVERAEGEEPIEVGYDIVELDVVPLASIAIHAAADQLPNLGLSGYRRHRDNWYRHHGLEMFMKVTGPSSPSPAFRARYSELNGHAFNSSDAFTLRGYISMEAWTRE